MDARTKKRLTIKYVFVFPKQTIMPDLFKKGVEDIDIQDVEYGIEWPASWNAKILNEGRGYLGPLDYNLKLVDKNEDAGLDDEDPYGTATKYTYLVWCEKSKLNDMIVFLKYLELDRSYNFY